MPRFGLSFTSLRARSAYRRYGLDPGRSRRKMTHIAALLIRQSASSENRFSVRTRDKSRA
jgi:hypothetical protein